MKTRLAPASLWINSDGTRPRKSRFSFSSKPDHRASRGKAKARAKQRRRRAS